MSNIAYIKFPAGDIKINLIDTPVVRQWKEMLQVWNERSIPLAVQKGNPFFHGAPHRKDSRKIDRETEIVDNLNAAIDKFNRITEGKKIPYRAWVDMPWKQTNLIHRCFTIASGSIKHLGNDDAIPTGKGLIEHYLTEQQLREYKDFALDNRWWLQEVTEYQFTFPYDNFKEVWTTLNEINMYVHFYENLRYSKSAATVHRRDLFDINIGWDNFTPTGGKTFFQCTTPSNKELKESIPDNWHEYDVFAIKSIKGKDYETAFTNGDDPMEYDIQNAQDITGGVRLFLGNSLENMYLKSKFRDWLDESGLEPYHYAPVPIGKIESTTFDFNDITVDPIELNTDGSPAMSPLYRFPTIELAEESKEHLI